MYVVWGGVGGGLTVHESRQCLLVHISFVRVSKSLDFPQFQRNCCRDDQIPTFAGWENSQEEGAL